MNKTSHPSRLVLVFVGFTSLACLCATAGKTAPPTETAGVIEATATTSLPALAADYHGAAPVATSTDGNLAGGIHEEIADKFKTRYQQWKKELLAAETGRQQWSAYETNPNFSLTLVVSRDNPEGATTGSYRWNDAGKLVAATITLGSRLYDGVPNPVYFPVMNSLLPTETTRRVDGTILAATKMAHEFGHVNRTASGDTLLYQLQSKLMPEYNQIFLGNGRDPNDPRLIALAQKMGGTPVEIWEDREYWGETNAMLYLRDRITEDGFRCLLFS